MFNDDDDPAFGLDNCPTAAKLLTDRAQKKAERDIDPDAIGMMDRPSAPFEVQVQDMGHGRAPVRPQPPMIKEIERFDDLQPMLASPYLIKGLLDRGAMSVVYGPSNSGKTFWALDIAYHVAALQFWRGRRVDGGAVLYLAAEGGNGIANRIVALRQAHNASNVPLYLRRAGLDLLKPEADVQRVVDLVTELNKQQKVVLIVIDTLSRVLAGGDENGPADMTAFVKNIDRIRHATGAHVMIVHHTGKDAARGARGHSSLRAATDTEIEISGGEDSARIATVQKQRDHAGGETFTFILESVELGVDQDGDSVRSCILTHTEAAANVQSGKRGGGLRGAEQIALDALADALAEDGRKREGENWPPLPVVHIDRWKAQCIRHGLCSSDKPASQLRAFERNADKLMELKRVRVFDNFAWIVPTA